MGVKPLVKVFEVRDQVNFPVKMCSIPLFNWSMSVGFGVLCDVWALSVESKLDDIRAGDLEC